MNLSQNAIQKISMALGLSTDEIPNHTTEITENLLYCCTPGRGGMHLITDVEGNMLVAVGAVTKDVLLVEYNNGRRTE